MSCQKQSQDNEKCLKEISEKFGLVNVPITASNNIDTPTQEIMNSQNVYEFDEKIYLDYMKCKCFQLYV